MGQEITKDYFDEQFEKLGIAIARGFEDTASKGDLTKLEQKFDGLETRFDTLKTRFDTLETKVDKLEVKVDVIQGKLDKALYIEHNRLEGRVTKIEKHLGFTAA